MKRLIKRLLLSFPPFNRYYSFRSSIINKVSLYNYLTNRLRIKMGGGEFIGLSAKLVKLYAPITYMLELIPILELGRGVIFKGMVVFILATLYN